MISYAFYLNVSVITKMRGDRNDRRAVVDLVTDNE